MDLTLSETQQLVRDSIRDYLEREVPFSRVREIERAGTMDTDLWKGLQELGWLGLPFPESVGGTAGTFLDLAILVEELTRRAVLIPIVEVMASALTIQKFGEAGQANQLLQRIINGEVIVVPAVLEKSARYDDIKASVSGGTLTADKYFVTYGQQATHHLVAAADGLYLVEAQGGNVSYRALVNIGRVPQAVVSYKGAQATKIAGTDATHYLIQLARALAAVQCLGCAQQALDMSVEYTSMRVQFGRPIGSFQAVQHHVANMATLVEATRFLAREAVWAIGEGVATDKKVAIAKAVASRTATEVPMTAHQLHGGIGFIVEYDLYFNSIRGKQAALSWGSQEECLAIVAESVDQDEDWLGIRSIEKKPVGV